MRAHLIISTEVNQIRICFQTENEQEKRVLETLMNNDRSYKGGHKNLYVSITKSGCVTGALDLGISNGSPVATNSFIGSLEKHELEE